jgi:hypothetical protein
MVGLGGLEPPTSPLSVLQSLVPQVLSTDPDFYTNALIQHGRTPKRVA